MPAKKNTTFEVPCYFMAFFLRTSLIALSIHLKVLFGRSCPLQIFAINQLKAIYKHYKICTLPNKKPLREIKMPG